MAVFDADHRATGGAAARQRLPHRHPHRRGRSEWRPKRWRRRRSPVGRRDRIRTAGALPGALPARCVRSFSPHCRVEPRSRRTSTPTAARCATRGSTHRAGRDAGSGVPRGRRPRHGHPGARAARAAPSGCARDSMSPRSAPIPLASRSSTPACLSQRRPSGRRSPDAVRRVRRAAPRARRGLVPPRSGHAELGEIVAGVKPGRTTARSSPSPISPASASRTRRSRAAAQFGNLEIWKCADL